MDRQIILDEIDILNEKIREIETKGILRNKVSKEAYPYIENNANILLSSIEITKLNKYISMRDELSKIINPSKTLTRK